ncbi:Tyrosine recombinase XerD [uncultured Leptotrichia sp.]|uniref:site-specific tyrosine recombinase/integron integrase n=1 Tax=uncultured Leptotrichia sp. TaxID=159271 RepID=UPI001A560DE4|nr:site-specific tyrosine recombinase/integron integrase [uncultured Leptotrichia sp.]VTX54112.1 Tyrosine recombinase XerD [uncultured Leptotrichia sp.]
MEDVINDELTKKNNKDVQEIRKNENLVVYVDKFLYYEEVILGKSFNTIRGYRRDLLQFMEYLEEYEEIHNFEEIEMMTFRSFIAYLNSPKRLEKDENTKDVKKKAKLKPVSKRSINRKISALRTFFNYLQEIKVIETNKASYINVPKFEKELPNVINRDDLNNLRHVINTEKITGIRDRLIIELLYSSGLRSIELINLSEFMIDIEEREIRVVGKGDKERITFFSENAKKWLIKYIEEKKKQYANYTREVLIVNSKGKKLTTRSLRRLISAHAHEAGIEKEITPHVFRHSFATELLNNGVDIRYLQELLGHSSIAATQVYTHVSKSLLRDIYMSTHPLSKE